MNVQFGLWNCDGRPVDPDDLERIESVLRPYGPDHHGRYLGMDICIECHGFRTIREERNETQPYTTPEGRIVVWDGRLDNRRELLSTCADQVESASTDVAIVAAAYESLRATAFSKFVGDWAVAIWDPHDRSLVLARDYVGVRHLCYQFETDRVRWSTILEPLVLLSGKTLSLSEEYLAGCFSSFPAAHLTPYVQIQVVPPSCFVTIKDGRRTIERYWDPDSRRRIDYPGDREYEEHFRVVFAEAVRRRIQSDFPIVAELSGGIDSSSIVCMADAIQPEGVAPGSPRLDTLSYFNDSEPNWNERPYFTKVEEKRGRAGCRIAIGSEESLRQQSTKVRLGLTPNSGGPPEEVREQIRAFTRSGGHRVLISGIGGDEFTGGVPEPEPELRDLLARARFAAFTRQLKAWSLVRRRPWFNLLFETLVGFFPWSTGSLPAHSRPAPWLHPDFAERNCAALAGYPSRSSVFGPLPSFQDNLSALATLRRQLGCYPPSSDPLLEKRYPFLDRDFIEFSFAVPRNQLVRPGERRSLLRRALHGIVPDEVLYRRRKAYGTRPILSAIASEARGLDEMSKNLMSASLGMVDAAKFREAIERVRVGQAVPVIQFTRTLAIELWLRGQSIEGRPFRELRVGVYGGATTRQDVFPNDVQLAGRTTNTERR